jgi:hypothetical protein
VICTGIRISSSGGRKHEQKCGSLIILGYDAIAG